MCKRSMSFVTSHSSHASDKSSCTSSLGIQPPNIVIPHRARVQDRYRSLSSRDTGPSRARNLQLPTLVLSCHMQSYYPSHLCISLLQIKTIYFSLVSASSHCVIFISTVELSIVSANTGLQRCKKKMTSPD
ncbi:Uncharacterized protein HZ326_12695 [Fusarium oxysporum f. sp. albedinis]|nr:Uncharacterized protein HZ326_12695 [Fusarium oxysporum f. sp. albedinis]